LHRVEICAKSGLLATDKCYENVTSASGAVVRHRTSYFELATDAQAPADPCDVHGDSVRTQLVKKFENSEWPRAALAVDTDQVAPVAMQAPTLVARDDPYDAIGSTFKPKTVAKQELPPAFDPEKPVKRALPVVPDPNGDGQVEVRRAEPVRPIDDSQNEPLLQNPTPPPLDFSDGH
jgi:hypothetical protein